MSKSTQIWTKISIFYQFDMGNIQFKCKIFGIFAEYSVFSRILGILQNIRFRQNIRHFESAEYSVSADSENLGFGRSLLGDYYQENGTSQRPFLLLRIDFPGRPNFIQLPPGPE